MILVTGGAGYIGTHVLCALAAAGHRAICVDNHVNSSPLALGRVALIAKSTVEAFNMNIADLDGIHGIARKYPITAVIHMAGLKAVGESVKQPERYWDNNVAGTMKLLDALEGSTIKQFIFSSSATVYGSANEPPIREDASISPQSPYGQNKVEIERVLHSWASANAQRSVVNLRYFNPVGAHESGLIGEDPAGTPNNLMPYICQVAAGRLKELSIFGNDYSTPDGTGIRDYVHVMDLAEGHVAALRAAEPGVATINLGIGKGCSVFEMLRTFERVNGVTVPYRVTARRPGDVATCYADVSRARRVLQWTAQRGIDDMCRDAWNWQQKNPAGYGA